MCRQHNVFATRTGVGGHFAAEGSTKTIFGKSLPRMVGCGGAGGPVVGAVAGAVVGAVVALVPGLSRGRDSIFIVQGN